MIAAIFDLDNTIIFGRSVERRFFYRLLRERRVGVREIARTAGFLLRNLSRFSPMLLHTHKLYLSDKSVSEMDQLAAKYIAEDAVPRILHQASAKLAQHRAAGHFLVILTGCPDFLMAHLGPHLKADAIICGQLEHREGRFTGKTLSPYPYGGGKRLLLDRLAATYNIDPAQSYAYADHFSDLEMLSAVRHPAVVNPDRRLARIAQARGWEAFHWLPAGCAAP